MHRVFVVRDPVWTGEILFQGFPLFFGCARTRFGHGSAVVAIVATP